jgi:hypothetical protein
MEPEHEDHEPLRVLTWDLHRTYLNYLAHTPHIFHLPVTERRPAGDGGRPRWRHRPDNIVEVPAQEVPALDLDCILFQSPQNYLDDQFEVLSSAQRGLPRVYLEHDPPRLDPTDTCHPMDDPNGLIVHVTPFNMLMWDNRSTPACVIEHGVTVPDHVPYTGELARGLVIADDLAGYGRRLGLDVFEQVRREVPLDLVGTGSERLAGLGEIAHADLPAFSARYRFVFSPIRYESLELAICESLMLGIPVIGLATTEMATTIRNGWNGYVDTDLPTLIAHMKRLIGDRREALRLSTNARMLARERFDIDRFARDWDEALTWACSQNRGARLRIGADQLEHAVTVGRD